MHSRHAARARQIPSHPKPVQPRDNYVTFEAAGSGNYTVLISASFPTQSGAYLLHLGRAPVSPGDEDVPLINGAQHLGTLPVGGLGVYSFSAGAGDGRTSANSAD